MLDDDSEDSDAAQGAFSDHNASWLKVKDDDDSDSDDNDEMEEGMMNSDSDESDGEETAIERRARLQDQKIRLAKEQAEKELKTNITDGEKFDLNNEDIQDLQDVNRRIQEIIGVLNNFKASKQDGVSRKDYLEKVRGREAFLIMIDQPTDLLL